MNFVKLSNYFKKSYTYIWFLPFAITAISLADQALAKPTNEAFESSIIVLAPTSMTSALHEIIKDFSTQNNISVSATFESSAELARLIEDGDPANVFITEDTARMKDLERMGVLNVYSFNNIASDKLVVAAPKHSYLFKILTQFSDNEEKIKFIAKNVSLVIPDPENDPSGKYAEAALEKLQVKDKVDQKMLKAANTANALYLVANGDNPGVVYYSDLQSNKELDLLAELPVDAKEPIIYKAAIVADIDSENTNAISKKFVDYLKSKEAQKIFAKYGFSGV